MKRYSAKGEKRSRLYNLAVLLLGLSVFGLVSYGGVKTYASLQVENVIKVETASCAVNKNMATVTSDREGLRLVFPDLKKSDGKSVRMQLDHELVPSGSFDIVQAIEAFNQAGGVQLPVVYGEHEVNIVKYEGGVDTVLGSKTISIVDPESLSCNEIHSVRFSTINTSYAGIVVDQYLKNFHDATAYRAIIHRADGSEVIREGAIDTINHINSGGNKALTTPFNFAGSSAGGWFGALDAFWTVQTRPVAVTIEVDTASSGLIKFTTPIEQKLVEDNGLYEDLIPVYEYKQEHSNYSYSERYVRANDFGAGASNNNVAVQVRAPLVADSLRVSFNNGEPIVSTDGINSQSDDNLYKAGEQHGLRVWRIKKALPEGEYSAVVEYRVGDTWYPVTGDPAKVIVVNPPTASIQYPSEDRSIFRPSDSNIVRLKVSDKFKSFDRAEFVVNGTKYEVKREDAGVDLRQEGKYLLVDIANSPSWQGLEEGVYKATVNAWSKANSRAYKTHEATIEFVIDNTKPVVTDFIVPESIGVANVDNPKIQVSARATDSNGIDSVRFYLAQMPEDGKPKNNLSGIREVTVNQSVDGVFSAEIDIDGLNGEYVALVSAKDKAAHHNVPLFKTVSIDNEFATISIVDPINNSAVAGVHRFVVTSDKDISKWLFSLNGKSYGSLLKQIEGSNNWYVDIDTATIPDGEYTITLRATDTSGNIRYWNNRGDTHRFTINNAPPEAPGVLGLRIRSSDEAVAYGGFINVSDVTATWEHESGEGLSYEYQYWNDVASSDWKEDARWVHGVGGDNFYKGTINQGDGTHYFCVVAINSLGNRSDCSSTFSYVYDSTAPRQSIEVVDEALLITADDLGAGVNSVYATLYLMQDDTEDSLVDELSEEGSTLSFSMTSLPNGDYYLIYSSEDKAGNRSESDRYDFSVNQVVDDPVDEVMSLSVTTPPSQPTGQPEQQINAGDVGAPSAGLNNRAVLGAGLTADDDGIRVDEPEGQVAGLSDNARTVSSGLAGAHAVGQVGQSNASGIGKWLAVVLGILGSLGILFALLRRREDSEEA